MLASEGTLLVAITPRFLNPPHRRRAWAGLYPTKIGPRQDFESTKAQ